MNDERVPFVLFSNDEIRRGEPLRPGLVQCPQGCGRRHRIRDGKPGGLVRGYKCRGRTFLLAIKWKRVVP